MTLNRIPPKFLADVMLGSLSRWLRLFGFDTLYRNDFKDRELIKISLQEDRVLLTRDRVLARCKILKKVLLITAEDLKGQIKEVLLSIDHITDFLQLPPRCPVCNGPTINIDKTEVIASVPDYIAISNDEFIKCSICQKIYWYGTHKQNIDQTKLNILKSLKMVQE